MLEHLQLFLGTPEQKLNHYMLRFADGQVQAITTDGFMMCVNDTGFTNSNGYAGTLAISEDEFMNILMWEGAECHLSADDHKLILRSGTYLVELKTLPSGNIPDLESIFRTPSVSSASTIISCANLELVTKYCKLINSDWFTLDFTGDDSAMIFTGKPGTGWKIYLMPMRK